MTSEHSNGFKYSKLCRVAIRYSMLDPKEWLQLPCSSQLRDISFVRAVVLDLASKPDGKRGCLNVQLGQSSSNVNPQTVLLEDLEVLAVAKVNLCVQMCLDNP